MRIRFQLAVQLLVAAFCLVAVPAVADNYPSKPIRLIVPFPAGGGVDVLARIIGQKMSDDFHQPVIVEDRPGAAGIIGTEAVARAAPNGYTLLLGTVGTHGINSSLYRRLPYDAIKDFTPISEIARVPNILVVHPAVPAHTVKELLALARARPGQLKFASAGSGTPIHLSGELFKSMGKVSMVHVPYRGAPQAMTDLLAGRVDMMFSNMPLALPYIKNGKLRALGVTTLQRASATPHVPTISEAGLPGYNVDTWYGIFAPAGAPAPVTSRLNSEINHILASPDVKRVFAAQGAEPLGTTPQQFSTTVRTDLVKWAKVVKQAGARVD